MKHFFSAALFAALFAGSIAATTISADAPTPCGGGLTPTECAAELDESLTDNGSTRVEVYEDGSGVQFVNGMPIRRFEADTFAWDCTAHGNKVCEEVTR